MGHVNDLEHVRARIRQAALDKIDQNSDHAPPAAAIAEIITEAVPSSDVREIAVEQLATRVGEAVMFTRRFEGNEPLVSIGDLTPLGSDLTTVAITNTNRPFLLDSIANELQALDIPIAHVLHPILPSDQTATQAAQSVIILDVDRSRIARLPDIEDRIRQVLHQVRIVVEDWPAMVDRLTVASDHIAPHDGEAAQFIDWLRDDNFVVLGIRDFSLEAGTLIPVEQTGLGILRDRGLQVLRVATEMVSATPEIERFLQGPDALIVTKANMISQVHRRVHMDYVGIKRFGSDGQVIGETRLVGLFTSSAYNRQARNIPLLRGKLKAVLDHFGHPPDSHSGKSLLNTLEVFPRDELFQISTATLIEWAPAIEDLELRPRLRIFIRRDEFDRFVSVLAYIPRDRFSTRTRKAIAKALERTFDGTVVATYPYFASTALVRVQFIVARFAGATPDIAADALEGEIAAIIETWEDQLGQAVQQAGDAAPELDVAAFSRAFEPGYREMYGPDRALTDYEKIRTLSQETPIAIDIRGDTPELTAALFNLGGPVPLSRRVPMLENLGFRVIDERSFAIAADIDLTEHNPEEAIALHDMALEAIVPIDLDTTRQQIADGFIASWHDKVHDDSFNRLIATTSMDWQEVNVLRAYAALLRQYQSGFDIALIAQALVSHADIAELLITAFRTLFTPDTRNLDDRKIEMNAINDRMRTALEDVASLQDDQIIRRLFALINATLRTNVFHPERETVALKIASEDLAFAPSPKPYREIFVFSPSVEGVHLRGGPIARGGIRWSDRAADYRTEVLGLAKAQQVKNAVIVPTGSKGGFVPAHLPPPSDRDAFVEAGKSSYRTFISALISLTDNVVDGAIVPPDHTVRWDDDDPYLVVAADKGTATFSDVANEISQQAGFWLDDAFASGGSAGYDHKAMGITARGAWEAVKRHFREMDRDIQAEPFTAIGVGDMSGDVFGNGMLLSKQTRLLAAFDHRDIFIDPDPDPASSWTERKRLFDLGRSSWQDYDASLISKGGGVYSRSSKSITLSAEARDWLGLPDEPHQPSAVMSAILRAQADLLWFGGIGTYVKADGESDAEVGDRANDGIRIAAKQLQAKVVGEGANLGMTQKARIAFDLAGGHINTDAIDNSAGVNSSDFEVNIKIALGQAERSGKLDRPTRNSVLAKMTDDVAHACLENNRAQALALSLAERNATADSGYLQSLMILLEQTAGLERIVEGLPDDVILAERFAAGEPLTRPELAVIMGYTKNAVIEALAASDLPDDPYYTETLRQYFPPLMREQFTAEIDSHQLRRNIIATVVANETVNIGGLALIPTMRAEGAPTLPQICKAFTLTRAVFGVDDLWREVQALDFSVPGHKQLFAFDALQKSMAKATAWFLAEAQIELPIADLLKRFEPARHISVTSAPDSPFVDTLSALPDELIARLIEMASVRQKLDVMRVASRLDQPIETAATALNRVREAVALDRATSAIPNLGITDQSERIAVSRLEDAIHLATRRATVSTGDKVDDWLTAHAKPLEELRRKGEDLARSERPSLAALLIYAQDLEKLAGHD